MRNVSICWNQKTPISHGAHLLQVKLSPKLCYPPFQSMTHFRDSPPCFSSASCCSFRTSNHLCLWLSTLSSVAVFLLVLLVKLDTWNLCCLPSIFRTTLPHTSVHRTARQFLPSGAPVQLCSVKKKKKIPCTFLHPGMTFVRFLRALASFSWWPHDGAKTFKWSNVFTIEGQEPAAFFYFFISEFLND